MPTTPTTQPPKAPAHKHAQARQAQALSRLGGVLVLFLFLGIPTVFVGLLLYGFVRKSRRRLGFLAPGMLVGLAVVGFGYRTVIAEAIAIQQLAAPYQLALRDLVRKPNKQNWAALQPAVNGVAPRVGHLWLVAVPLAPLVALYLESTHTKTVTEQREEKQRKERSQEKEARRRAAQKVKGAPEQAGRLAVIGVPLGGDLDWRMKDWAVYSPQMLNRHAVIIGGSGTGKTEFILRVAYVARKIYGWKVFYIDAKGDPMNAQRFRDVMARADVGHVPVFPDQTYNGWVGDATTLLNRLIAIEDYSEPYYRAVAKTVLTLAVKAPSGPPRTSEQLLRRLRLSALAELYQGEQSIRTEALNSLTEENVNGVQRRYFGFFDALGGKLDGGWSFDSADAAYIVLEGLALKEEARSLGRYLLEDFANYVSKRKPADQPILLIIDEFSALSGGGADAANLFERLRSFGAGIMVTSQTNEGLGEDAKKLIGAAAVTIAFQCADPEAIAARAGMVKEVQSALAVELSAIPGRNPLMSGKEHVSGTSVQREQEVLKLHPDTIRRLDIGECCIITNGAYQAVKVARVPERATGVKETRKAATGQRRPANQITPPRAIPVTRPQRARPAEPIASAAEEVQVRAPEELDLIPLTYRANDAAVLQGDSVAGAEEITSQDVPKPPAGDGQTSEDHAIQDGQTVLTDAVRADGAKLPSQTPDLAGEAGPAAIGGTIHLRDQKKDSQAELDL